MKRILLSLIIIATITISSFSQTPQGFKYQAVVRDAGNILLNNQAVGMQMTIQQGAIGGTTVYKERFSSTTNAFGLVNLDIGNGTVVSGTFASIDWSAGPYFIETAVDVTGGTSYAVMGTSQLMSVPYALYAKTSGSSTPGPQGVQGPIGPVGNTGAAGVAGAAGTTGQAITEVYGTGQLVVSTSTTTYTLIPGMTQTITVPANCKVFVSSTGGMQSTGATSTTFSVVDVALFCDGVASSTGGQRRISIANTTALAQLISNWSLTQTYTLSAGSHTFEVKAVSGAAGSSNANVSSASAPQLQGVLTVSIIKL